MRNLLLFPLSVAFLLGCERTTEPAPDPNTTLQMSACKSALAKAGADAPEKATLGYIGKDSLDFSIQSMSLQCGSEYILAYPSVSNGTGLLFEMVRAKDSGEKCLCDREVRVRVKSKGEDFSVIKIVSVNGVEYELSDVAP